MPALPLDTIFSSLSTRHEALELAANTNPVTNTSDDFLPVICAWPVSGQYGPGARVLYYALVATCVIARKAEWLRNACLAAALLFPAVAAVHGIVLASVHIPDAVDLDVYGAFQLCALGALAAPVTVRLSRTYFYDNGRNLIFLWTLLVLAGLISLAVEFYRLNDTPCSANEGQGDPSGYTLATFPYGRATCGMTCSTDDGPFSSIRGGSADNIYVVPSPTSITFNAGMLLSAGCCIPAVLLLLSMWIKILESNRKSQDKWPESDANDAILRDADTEETVAERRHRSVIRAFSRYGEKIMLCLAAAAILALLIAGERNLFSHQLRYQTEPMANVGQWAPVLGTGLAVFGSLYILLAEAMKEEREIMAHEHDPSPQPIHLVQHVAQDKDIYAGDLHHGERAVVLVDQSGTTRHHTVDFDLLDIRTATVKDIWSEHVCETVGTYTAKVAANSALLLHLSDVQTPDRSPMNPAGCPSQAGSTGSRASKHEREHVEATDEDKNKGSSTSSMNAMQRFFRSRPRMGIIHIVARILINVTDYFATPAEGRLDSNFRKGEAALYPGIPGEEHRNSNYQYTRSHYRSRRDSLGSLASALTRQTSRPRSVAPSMRSRSDTAAGAEQSQSPGRGRRRSTLDVPDQRGAMPNISSQVAPSNEDDIVAVPGSPIAPAITVSTVYDSPRSQAERDDFASGSPK